MNDFLMCKLLSLIILLISCLAAPRQLAASTEGLLQIADDISALAKQYAIVVDRPSAIEAAPRIEALYDKLFQTIDRALAERARELDRVYSDQEREQVKAAMRKAEDGLLAELKRIDRISGLPAEFWDVSRLGDFRYQLALARSTGEFDDAQRWAEVEALTEIIRLCEKFGPRHVVELYVTECGISDRTAVMMQLNEALGADAAVVDFSDLEDERTMTVVVAPVADFAALLARINLGKITRQDPARRVVIVTYEPTMPAPKHNAFREVDEKSPQYHAQLADLLADEHAIHHRDAVQRLLRIEPADVTDKNVRREIARGFRKLAFDSPFEHHEGVQGLIIWGGEHSVPLLIELLQRDHPLGADEAIFSGLAKYPTPEGARAVATRLGNRLDRGLAALSLARMGSIGEDAVLAILPANDSGVNVAAIRVLGEVGTKKSAAILRRAKESRDPHVRLAAAAASKAIRLRERQSAAATTP